MTQRDNDGAGERGGIDNVGAAELLRVRNGVDQDEAAFRIGVQDLNGFPGHRSNDVAGSLGFAAGHIFNGRHDARDGD